MDQVILDVAILLMILARAAVGFRSGLAFGASSLIGMVVGGATGLWLGPMAVSLMPSWASSPVIRTMLVLSAILVGSVVGEALLSVMGRRLRSSLADHAVSRSLDSVLGAILSTLVVSLVLWFVGAAVRPLLPDSWARVMNQSRVLATLDAGVPDTWNALPSKTTDALAAGGIPRVFSGLMPEPMLPVPVPDAGSSQTAAVRQAASSVVQVFSDAPSCGTDSAGSGWVVAQQRVVTNAHVVAGASTVTVRVGGTGAPLPASVVAFDPNLDLAILSVPHLGSRPLARAGAQPDQTPVVAAGYPMGGPYSLSPARVRGTVLARGEDIYRAESVTREVYSIRAVLRPGNSGGPLLTAGGEVAGTVFAASMVDAETGYALTDKATDRLLDQAAALRGPVSTGACPVR